MDLTCHHLLESSAYMRYASRYAMTAWTQQECTASTTYVCLSTTTENFFGLRPGRPDGGCNGS